MGLTALQLVDEMSTLDTINEVMAAHRPLWEEISHGIPAWHPRAEGDGGDAGDGGGDDDGGTGAGDTGREGTTPAQQAVIDAAHTKLREAEKRAEKLAAQVKRFERAQMDSDERAKAEQKDKDDKITALEARLNAADQKEKVEAIATELKFKNPKAALRFVGSALEEKDIRDALRDAVKDIPELIGSGALPPPVNQNGPGGQNNGSENARMNNMLRSAAGRR